MGNEVNQISGVDCKIAICFCVIKCGVKIPDDLILRNTERPDPALRELPLPFIIPFIRKDDMGVAEMQKRQRLFKSDVQSDFLQIHTFQFSPLDSK